MGVSACKCISPIPSLQGACPCLDYTLTTLSHCCRRKLNLLTRVELEAPIPEGDIKGKQRNCAISESGQQGALGSLHSPPHPEIGLSPAWYAIAHDKRSYQPTHKKRGPTVFSGILRKSQSKIVVQNFTISQVCKFVFESYGAAHALPCFVEVFSGKLKFQELFCSLLEQNCMNDREVTAG